MELYNGKATIAEVDTENLQKWQINPSKGAPLSEDEAAVTGEALAVIAPSSNKTIGVKSREYWGFRIVDPLLVPRAYCKPDEVAIGAYKDAARKNGAKVEDLKMDGVEFYREIRV